MKHNNCKINGIKLQEILVTDQKLITFARDISEDNNDPSKTIDNLSLLKKEISELYAADITGNRTYRQSRPVIIADRIEVRDIEKELQHSKLNGFVLPRDDYEEQLQWITKREIANSNYTEIPEQVLRNFETWIEVPDRPKTFPGRLEDYIKFPKDKRRFTLPSEYEKTETRHKRLAGPPGTGKTTILINFVVNSLLDGRDVLLSCFNITMVPYLHSMLYPFLPDSGNLVIANYHNILRRVFYQAGLSQNFAEIFQNYTHESDREREINNLFHDALNAEKIQFFNTLVVDEGQDFEPDWWLNLKGLIRNKSDEKKSHYLIAYDYGQNLYDRPLWLNSDTAKYGFKGKVGSTEKSLDDGKVTISYRMPFSVIQLANAIAKHYLAFDKNLDLPEPESINESSHIEWINTSNVEGVVRAIRSFMGNELKDPETEVQTAIAIDSKLKGKEIFNQLRNITSKEINHLYNSGTEEKIAKLSFSPVERVYENGEFKLKRSKKILMSTWHSIKGWEVDKLIIIATNLTKAAHFRAFYVMLTRIRKGSDPKLLIITLDPENNMGPKSEFSKIITPYVDSIIRDVELNV
jgi:hypothetical protein